MALVSGELWNISCRLVRLVIALYNLYLYTLLTCMACIWKNKHFSSLIQTCVTLDVFPMHSEFVDTRDDAHQYFHTTLKTHINTKEITVSFLLLRVFISLFLWLMHIFSDTSHYGTTVKRFKELKFQNFPAFGHSGCSRRALRGSDAQKARNSGKADALSQTLLVNWGCTILEISAIFNMSA